MVFDKLIQAGFAVKCEKVWLAMNEVPYLGFLVGANGTRPHPSKTAALLDMVCEDMGTDPSAAASYAGMIGFYHAHIPDLHSTLAPFHELKQKNCDAKRIMTSLRFKAAFAYTKYQLANAAALARPDFSQPFYIDVDSASSVGSGAILCQYTDPSDPNSLTPLAFWSRRFTSEERRYGVRDQECMGLVGALTNWRCYVVGAPTVVRTDHKSLESLFTSNHRDGTRIQNLAHKTQGYDVTIQYTPGSDHIAPDCMSRSIPKGPGGEERGTLDARPDIESRVDEALDADASTVLAPSPPPSPPSPPPQSFYIDVDSASSAGSSATLYRSTDSSPLASWSRRFTSGERRYGTSLDSPADLQSPAPSSSPLQRILRSLSSRFFSLSWPRTSLLSPVTANRDVARNSKHSTSVHLGLAADSVAQADYDMAAAPLADQPGRAFWTIPEPGRQYATALEVIRQHREWLRSKAGGVLPFINSREIYFSFPQFNAHLDKGPAVHGRHNINSLPTALRDSLLWLGERFLERLPASVRKTSDPLVLALLQTNDGNTDRGPHYDHVYQGCAVGTLTVDGHCVVTLEDMSTDTVDVPPLQFNQTSGQLYFLYANGLTNGRHGVRATDRFSITFRYLRRSHASLPSPPPSLPASPPSTPPRTPSPLPLDSPSAPATPHAPSSLPSARHLPSSSDANDLLDHTERAGHGYAARAALGLSSVPELLHDRHMRWPSWSRADPSECADGARDLAQPPDPSPSFAPPRLSPNVRARHCITPNDAVTSLLLVSYNSGHPLLLVERRTDELNLPGCLCLGNRGVTRRSQLCEHLLRSYSTSCYSVVKQLGDSSLSRKRINRRFRNDRYRYRLVYFSVIVDSLPDLRSAWDSFEVDSIFLDSSSVSRLTNPLDRSNLEHFLLHTCPSRLLPPSFAHQATVEDVTLSPFAKLIDERAPCISAMRALSQRLRAFPGLPASVDLEGSQLGAGGHISTLQIAVDHPSSLGLSPPVDEDMSPLIFVFDILAIGRIALGSSGVDTLRSILEDGDIPKVLHCCYGDTASLYQGFNISVRGIFDTGIADALALSRHANKMRKLDKVLFHWLGEDNVHLSYKSTFTHSDHIWDTRPLPPRMVIYAYEDVSYCNQLYLALREALRRDGLWELALTLSQQRAPPIALPYRHPSYAPPTSFAIALVDRDDNVICLQDLSTGLCSLPSSATPSGAREPSLLKEHARQSWPTLMGPTPKFPRAALNSRMRKAVRIGDTLLYCAWLDDCMRHLASLQEAYRMLHGEGCRLVVRKRYRPAHSSSGVIASQRCLFQQLHAESSRTPQANSAFVYAFSIGSLPGNLHVSCSLSLVGSRISLALSPLVLADEVSIPAVGAPHTTAVSDDACANPPLTTSHTALTDPSPHLPEVNSASSASSIARVATILHDDAHVFVLVNREGSFVFPDASCQPGVSVLETAERAFDDAAGVSLRKRMGVGNPNAQLLMPKASRFVRAACERATQLPSIPGNVAFVSWHLPSLDGLVLFDHLAAFHSSRNAISGFEMTPERAKKLPSFLLATHQSALEHLRPREQDSLRAAIRLSATRDTLCAFTAELPPDPSPVPLSQHSESTSTSSFTSCLHALCKRWNDCPSFKAGRSSAARRRRRHDTDDSPTFLQQVAKLLADNFQSRYSIDLTSDCEVATEAFTVCEDCAEDFTGRGLSQHSDPTTPLGDDVEFDALFSGAVALHYSRIESAQSRIASSCSAESKLPVLSFSDILQDQLSHPATAQYIEYLRTGRFDPVLDELEGERASVESEASHLFLETRDYCPGLLMRRSQRDGAFPLVVLPPRSQKVVLRIYHDYNNHFGIKIVLSQISARYYWGSSTDMRKTISEYIKRCIPCARAKIPSFAAGEFQLDEPPSGPGQVLSADAYEVGVVYDDYSHTLDFADHHSRGIISEPTKGVPDSSQVADIVVNTVIRRKGTPREIRSDRGSNLISEALRLLYERLRIRINAGTAYTHHLVGLLERWHRTLKQLLRVQKAAGYDDNWPSRLAMLELAFNSATNSTTTYSPFFVENLRHSVLPLAAMVTPPSADDGDLPQWVRRHLADQRLVYDTVTQSLRLNALTAKKKYDSRRDTQLFYQPGDRVLVIEGKVFQGLPFPKTDLPTFGPFTVEERLSHDRYRLKDMGNRRIHPVIHVSRLLPFPDVNDDTYPWMVSDPVSGGRWPVHSVLGRRALPSGGFAYKLRWAGFSGVYHSWRERRHLDSIAHLIQLYEESAGLLPPQPPHAVHDLPQPESPSPTASTARFRFRPHPPVSSTPVNPPVDTSFDYLSEPLPRPDSPPAEAPATSPPPSVLPRPLSPAPPPASSPPLVLDPRAQRRIARDALLKSRGTR